MHGFLRGYKGRSAITLIQIFEGDTNRLPKQNSKSYPILDTEKGLKRYRSNALEDIVPTNVFKLYIYSMLLYILNLIFKYSTSILVSEYFTRAGRFAESKKYDKYLSLEVEMELRQNISRDVHNRH